MMSKAVARCHAVGRRVELERRPDAGVRKTSGASMMTAKPWKREILPNTEAHANFDSHESLTGQELQDTTGKESDAQGLT